LENLAEIHILNERKIEAARLHRMSGRPLSETAREIGVSGWTLSRFLRQAETKAGQLHMSLLNRLTENSNFRLDMVLYTIIYQAKHMRVIIRFLILGQPANSLARISESILSFLILASAIARSFCGWARSTSSVISSSQSYIPPQL